MCFSFVLGSRRVGGFNGDRLKLVAARSSKTGEIFVSFLACDGKHKNLRSVLLERPEPRTVLCLAID
jgi:hypothetical protein